MPKNITLFIKCITLAKRYIDSINKFITPSSTHHKSSSPQINQIWIYYRSEFLKTTDRSDQSLWPVRLVWLRQTTLNWSPFFLPSLGFHPRDSSPLSSFNLMFFSPFVIYHQKGHERRNMLALHCPLPPPFPPEGDWPSHSWTPRGGPKIVSDALAIIRSAS